MLDQSGMTRYKRVMNKLNSAQRAEIISLLCEGMSMRAIARNTSVSLNTVTKLLIDAGKVCDAFHNEAVRSVSSKRVQCDEIWAFTYAKQKNVATAKAAPEGAGDTWTWTAIDADSQVHHLLFGWRPGWRIRL